MNPKISVIIPAYNAEKYIDRCLNSIVNQTYGVHNLEIIVVDDASTDNTAKHIEFFEKRFPDNVLLIKCSENGRQGIARNIGLDYASGDYISFIDADDMMDHTMLKKMMDAALKYDCDEVECGYSMFRNEADAIITNDIQKSYYLDLRDTDKRKAFILDSLKIAVWGRLYKRSIIEENRLRFVGHLFYEDVQFSGLTMFMINSYYRINETLYYYYMNEEGTIHSHNNIEKIRQEIAVMDKYLEELCERDMLDKIISTYGKEFEFYCVNKCFMDPFAFITSGKQSLESTLESIDHFKAHILDLFPDAGRNQYFKNLSGIYKLAANILAGNKSETESIFTKGHAKIILLIHDNKFEETLAKRKSFLSNTYPDYTIAEMSNETYLCEYPLLRQALCPNDMIAFSISNDSEVQDQKAAESFLRSAVYLHKDNKLIIFFSTLSFSDSGECISVPTESIDFYKDHDDLTIVFADKNDYEIAQRIIPKKAKILMY